MADLRERQNRQLAEKVALIVAGLGFACAAFTPWWSFVDWDMVRLQLHEPIVLIGDGALLAGALLVALLPRVHTRALALLATGTVALLAGLAGTYLAFDRKELFLDAGFSWTLGPGLLMMLAAGTLMVAMGYISLRSKAAVSDVSAAFAWRTPGSELPAIVDEDDEESFERLHFDADGEPEFVPGPVPGRSLLPHAAREPMRRLWGEVPQQVELATPFATDVSVSVRCAHCMCVMAVPEARPIEVQCPQCSDWSVLNPPEEFAE